MLKSLFLEQMYWFLLFFYKCIVDRYIFGSNVLLRSKRGFFFFVFRGANGRPSAAVPGSHRLTCLTSQTEKTSENKEQKKRENET